MLEERISQCIEECYDEIINCQSEQVNQLFKTIKKEVNQESFEDIIKEVTRNTVAQIIATEMPGEYVEELLCYNLENLIANLGDYKKSYVFECRLRGQEDYVNRIIEVPSYLTLEDFCYCVLGSFNAEGYHMFSVDYRKDTFYCRQFNDQFYDEDEMLYVDDCSLNDLSIRKNSKLVLTYDFGDNYEFEIKLKEVKNNNCLVNIDDMKVIDGKGYGIWEDNHHLLDMYYDDKNEYDRFVEEEGYDIECAPMEEEFILDEADLFEDFMRFKTIVEDMI